jgi:hypothetical protein
MFISPISYLVVRGVVGLEVVLQVFIELLLGRELGLVIWLSPGGSSRSSP